MDRAYRLRSREARHCRPPLALPGPRRHAGMRMPQRRTGQLQGMGAFAIQAGDLCD